MATDRHVVAISHIMQAILRDKDSCQSKNIFIHLVQGRPIPGEYSKVKQVLEICLEDDSLSCQPLLVGLLHIFSQEQDFLALRQISSCSSYDAFTKEIAQEQIEQIVKDALLLAALPAVYATNPLLEKALTYLRRYFAAQAGSSDLGVFLDFLSALGLHCFQNEYVFFQEPEEDRICQKIREVIETADPSETANKALIAVHSCYQPLAKLKNAKFIIDSAKATKNARFAKLVKRQIIEPTKEEKIKKTIPVLTHIKDSVSLKVREQYEENPYPRWLSPHFSARRILREPRDEEKTFLNAGCGTGKSPISFALKYPNAHITGVDLSLSSLAYAQRKAAEMGVANISFAQADILELGSWDRKFDVITSGGVIHHLKNPIEGWRILVSLLKPGGVLKLALYRERARQPQVAGQKWIKENYIQPNPEGIRAFRKYVFECGETDPMKPILRMHDFYSLSNCRDLVFHVMEHRFTCPDIMEAMSELEVKFLGFVNLRPTIKKRYHEMFPHDMAMRNLESWDLLERRYPKIFTLMYQFWCCRKNERPRNNLPAWLH